MNQYCTDTFNLSESEIFKYLRKNNGLPDDRSYTQNLIESKDDILFIWNSKECCVLSINWRAISIKDDQEIIPFQTLRPSETLNYTVDKITASPEGSYLALSGNHGVAIMELPRRLGRHGQFQGGEKKMFCSTHNLDEKFFMNNTYVEVLQTRWHPASPKDSHLLVLFSNNSMRLYEENVLRHIWRIGPVPCAALPPPTTSANHGNNNNHSRQTQYLTSLGDTAVDFDIAPPRVVGNNDNNCTIIATSNTNETRSVNSDGDVTRVEWPLIILRGNGDLYVIFIGIDTEKPQIQGPLVISPSSKTNYGTDYCSIMVLQSLPPTLIIAETNGNLHHGILLENESPQETFNEIDSSLAIYPSEYTVYVFETVVLELGIHENNSKSTICPIHLKRDLLNETRYFAYHNTGLHVITVDFIQQLQQFVASENANIEDLSVYNKTSQAEYVICTKAIETTKSNSVLGFTLLLSPSGLVLLLASGQVVSLSLMNDPGFLRDVSSTKTTPHIVASSAIGNSGTIQKLSSTTVNGGHTFDLYIKNILSSKISSPIFQLDKTNEPTPKDMLELLMHSTHILREQYFLNHDKAKQEIEKRVRVLCLMKEQQRHELDQLLVDKENIRSNAERLAEMYEDICEKQQVLFKRAQDVVRMVTLNNPQSIVAEKEFQQKIEKINEITKRLSNQLVLAKRKNDNQENQINQFNVGNKITSNKITIQPRMEATIKVTLAELTLEIDGQIKEIKTIKNRLNIC